MLAEISHSCSFFKMVENLGSGLLYLRSFSTVRSDRLDTATPVPQRVLEFQACCRITRWV